MPYATTITPHPPERRPRRALPGLIPAALANAAIEERFAAYIAHELRTPLTTQRALLELALTDPLADTDSWRDVAEDVLDACLQQERLLEACLTLARSSQGLRRRDRIDLAAIAQEALLANDRSGLDSMFALEPAEIRGDAVLVDRLATNLVSNAIRHTRPGGRIEIATRAQAGRAYLIVANTGPRIPAAELHRLFQPFQRFDDQTRPHSDGIGLGLPIVQAIATAHNANFTAEASNAGGLRIQVQFAAVPS